MKSETKNFKILDSNGCEIDPQFLETPDYSKFLKKPRKGDAYVYKEMSVFKFPSDNNVVFQCQISLCDMESGASCISKIVRILPQIYFSTQIFFLPPYAPFLLLAFNFTETPFHWKFT